MDKLIRIDPAQCVGCRTCEMVCSLVHYDEVNPARSRIKVIKWEAQGHFIPTNCRHCEDAPCMAVCPAGAIQQRFEPYAVVVDPKRCIGCRACVLVCPFGAAAFDGPTRRIAKCNLCDGDPQCVNFCAYGALTFTQIEAFHHERREASATTLHEQLFAERQP